MAKLTAGCQLAVVKGGMQHVRRGHIRIWKLGLESTALSQCHAKRRGMLNLHFCSLVHDSGADVCAGE